ncbi:MAG: H-NS family nucleoid-associated regulatory protein [Endozoicomonadaceae bacterium]|nr:H-NS family nucleoid-associated regulatory protein [Endozoicomonadaceae bacterium]MCY4330009.1 H-NS family nucleoid-associated regulatory protein [Endozoicomonadaceae bacterium]
MNIYDELLHRLSSKVRIRNLFKDLHLEDIERIIQRCTEVKEEKQQELQIKENRLQQKKQNIEEIRKILDEKGLSVSDLEEVIDATPRRRRNVQKFIFEYETSTGELIQWHGSTTGRLPKEFQKFLNRTGKKRTDCVVENIS